MKKGLKLNTKFDYIQCVLWLMFFCQVIVLGFFNLTQLQYHMGFDASSYFLKTMEIVKQGTLFISNWVDQTTLYFDAPVPFAALIYAITGNIFFSYGLVNFAIDIAIFYVFYLILRYLKVSGLAKAICLNLIACIYLPPNFNNANDVSYFSSMLSSGNWYGFKVLIILMVIKMIMDLENHKVNYAYIVVTEILLFVSGVSSGWYLLVTIVAPLMVFYVIRMFVKNSYKEIINTRMFLLVLSSIVVVSGKYTALHVLNFESKDSSMVLVGLNDFWKNIGSIVLGFVELVGGFPHESDMEALDIKGIICLIGFAIFIMCIIGTIYIVHKMVKNFAEYDMHAILMIVVGFNVLMFSVLYTTYGQEIFEVRYLIPLFLLLATTVGTFTDSLEDGLVFKWIWVLGIFGCLLMLNVYNDSLFYKTKNNYDILTEITDTVEELDTQVVYVYGTDLNVDIRNLRVVDGERVYKYIYDGLYNITPHWGDYTYYDDAADVPGRNVLISTMDYMDSLPDYIKNQYNLYAQIDRYTIYVAEVNKIDFSSGVNGEYSLDYPTSNGICFAGGSLDDNGNFVSDGTEGQVMWGPGYSIEEGVYDFIINYEILQSGEKTADFLITLNAGENVLASVTLEEGQYSAVINNVSITQSGEGFEYKVYNYQGTVIKVNSFEVVRTSF